MLNVIVLVGDSFVDVVVVACVTVSIACNDAGPITSGSHSTQATIVIVIFIIFVVDVVIIVVGLANLVICTTNEDVARILALGVIANIAVRISAVFVGAVLAAHRLLVLRWRSLTHRINCHGWRRRLVDIDENWRATSGFKCLLLLLL